jgi:hypothetical protein
MRAFVAIVVLAVLTACGPMPETAPTAAPETTPPTLDTTATPGTPAPDELTLGDIAQRVVAAWPGVRSYRVTFTGSTIAMSAALGTPVAQPLSTPAATPMATPGATPLARTRETFVLVREVVLPDHQRQELSGLGNRDHEAIAVGNELFVKGPLVEDIAPGTPPDVWIEIDPATIPQGAVISQMLGGLPQLAAAPLASLPERLLPQVVREIETVEHDGRECQVYGAADTVQATGMRVDYTIAIDEGDIPCFIETSAGGVTQGRDEYTDIDAALTIEPPAAATPVAIPPALATPLARD